MSYTYTTADIIKTVNKTAAKMGRSVNDSATFTSKEFDAVHEWYTPTLPTLVKRGAVVVDHSETLSAKGDFKASIVSNSDTSVFVMRGVFHNVTADVMDTLIAGVGIGRAAMAASPKLRDAMAKYGIDPATLESEDNRYSVKFEKLEPYTFKRNHYRFTLANFAAKVAEDVADEIADTRRESENAAAEYARKIDALADDLAKLQDMASAA